MLGTPEVIDARAVLAPFHKGDAIVCDTVQLITPTLVEAKYVVNPALCRPTAYAPMFSYVKSADGLIQTQIGEKDSVKVVPTHKIVGLVQQILSGSLLPQYISFEHMRFPEFVTQGQKISFTSKVENSREGRIAGTFTLEGERSAFMKRFQVEGAKPYPNRLNNPPLPQHWLIEHNAQALAVVGLTELDSKDKLPVLTNCGASSFSVMPVYAGDTLISRFSILSVSDKQIVGNAENFLGQFKVGEQERVVVEFLSAAQIAARTRKVAAAA